jgi:alpha-galactosidase
MVNAMLCRIHQSGDIAGLSPASFAQVKTGLEIYKQVIRPHIPDSIPFFPLGMPDMTNRTSPVCLGSKAPAASFLAVWRLAGTETVRIPTSAANARLLYPTDRGIKLSTEASNLRLVFPRPYMACIVAR